MNKYSFCFFILVFLFIVVHLFFSFNGLYGQDSYIYLRYSEQLRKALFTGHPPEQIFFAIGFPIYGTFFSLLFQNVIFSLLLVSFFGLLMCLYFAHKIITLLYPHSINSIFYLFLFLALSPAFLRSSMTVMSDVFCAGFVTASFYYALVYSKWMKQKHFILFFFCLGNCLLIRYASSVLLIPVAFWTIYNFLNQKNKFQIMFALLIFMVVLIPNYFLKRDYFIDLFSHQSLHDWSLKNYFSRSFNTNDGYLTYWLPNLIYYLLIVFHPSYFIAGVLFLVVTFWKKKLSSFEIVILFSIIIYLLFLAGIPMQNRRYLAILLPLFIILGYHGFEYYWIKIKNKKLVSVIFLFFQFGLFILVFSSFYSRNKLEKNIFNYLNKHTTQSVLYSFDLDVSLKGNGLQKTFNNLGECQYEKFEHKSLVLFNPTALQIQWKKNNPMINWESINKDYDLKLLNEFDYGWVLYEIQ